MRLAPVLTLLAACAVVGCDSPPAAASVPEWTPADHDHSDDKQNVASGAQVAGAAGKDDGSRALVEVTWRNQCATCHGALGHGDGPNGPMVRATDLDQRRVAVERHRRADCRLDSRTARERCLASTCRRTSWPGSSPGSGRRAVVERCYSSVSPRRPCLRAISWRCFRSIFASRAAALTFPPWRPSSHLTYRRSNSASYFAPRLPVGLARLEVERRVGGPGRRAGRTTRPSSVLPVACAM